MSDRGGAGLLKAHAESFARHLQSRLQSLHLGLSHGASDSSETLSDLESPPLSPQEVASEPIFIANQNRNSLQRSDSEASTYFDAVQDLEELEAHSVFSSRVPRALQQLKTDTSTESENGDLSPSDAAIPVPSVTELDETDRCYLGLSSVLDDEPDNLGRFDKSSLRLEPEAVAWDCDNCVFQRNEVNGNNLGNTGSDLCSKHKCEVSTVGVSHTYEKYCPSNGVGENNMSCVFCDFEQIKSNSSTGTLESQVKIESNNGVGDTSHLSNGVSEPSFLGNAIHLHESKTNIFSITDSHNNNVIKLSTSEATEEMDPQYEENNTLLTDLLQELKKEILEDRKTNLENSEEKSNRCLSACPSIMISKSPSLDIADPSTPTDRKEIDEYDIETKRKNFKRSSSLKCGKTPPGTPGSKKIVRFADVLGLDLANVKTFLDEVPTVPMSAFEDLQVPDPTSTPATSSMTFVSPQTTPVAKTLTPLFSQPCVQPNFLDRVRLNSVCLENAVVSDLALSAITGLVRVKNVDFHKSVYVRYTINGWASFSDLQAKYVPNSHDGFSDKFRFLLYAHTLSVGQRLQFAVKYQAGGAQFWDNNGGLNYVFECSAVAPARTFTLPDIHGSSEISSFY